MNTILFILEKEFRQIFRNRAMLPIIFVLPVVQLLILSFAVDYEIKNLDLYVLDRDNSSFSRELTGKFFSSGYFRSSGSALNPEQAERSLSAGNSDVILVIPGNFERDLVTTGMADVQLLADAIDGAKAGLAAGYASGIIMDFNRILVAEKAIPYGRAGIRVAQPTEVLPVFRFNPLMDYKSYMIPGILVILITMIGAFLSSMNIVREKELGTIEQINVTPIRKYHFILGKTIPFWILALFELSIGLIAAKLIFDIPMVGPLWVLYLFAAIYLFLVLGFGLFISTLTETQQQAMFISWFFLVIFILMGGLFTAIENMPLWAQTVTLFNPVRYFIEVTRNVMLKGSGFTDVIDHFMIIGGYAVLMVTAAVLRYRKTA